MDTPICDFVNEYNKKGTIRLHMPGHKGSPFLGCEPLDITEVKGADELYNASGIIEKSEKNAARLFDTRATFYSAGGSSQCITAMVFLAYLRRENKKSRTILAARNAHRTFLNACALLDLEAEWLYPQSTDSLCACPIEAEKTREHISKMKNKPFALYITSPDYLGGMADINGLRDVCRDMGIPLLVDNAHGAYLKFIENASLHPMELGADMCCDSAHKTLPVLTGGAYLHIGKDAKKSYEKDGKRAMALFGSTSPSYLILQSLDMCNRLLYEGYDKKINDCAGAVSAMTKRLKKKNVPLRQTEPLKLVIRCGETVYSGVEAAELLRERGIECEFADQEHLVLMISPEISKKALLDLENSLTDIISVRKDKAFDNIPSVRGEKVLSIREAMLSEGEKIEAEDALGRICAAPTVSCPPAIPIAISGERITREMIELFKHYGIDEIEVVRE